MQGDNKPLIAPAKPSSDELKITVPLELFVKVLLNRRKSFLLDEIYLNDNIAVTQQLAVLLRLVDKKEEFIHVTFPGEDGHPKDSKHPLIWEKKAWELSYQRWLHLKELQYADAIACETRNMKIVELRDAIRKNLLDAGYPERTVSEAAQKTAVDIVMRKRYIEALIYGVDIKALPDSQTKDVTIVNDVFNDLWQKYP